MKYKKLLRCQYAAMIRTSSFLLSLCCCMMAYPQSQTEDPLFDLLRHEVKYYYDNLRTDTVPPRFISLRALDEREININSDMGRASLRESASRKLCPIVLFGEYDKDKPLYPFDFSEEEWSNSQLHVADLPLKNDTAVIKHVIWNALGRMYQGAMTIWMKSSNHLPRTSVAPDEITPAEVHYEEPLAELHFDKERWQNLLNEVTSEQGRKMPGSACQASLQCQSQRRYIVDSEGTAVVCNRRIFSLSLCVKVKDDKGVECPLTKDYFGYEESEMPDKATLKADMESLALRAQALSKAPMADAYSGPVILSGHASAILFHEVLGHRLEHQDSEFQSMKDTPVLPSGFTVSCNPTQKYFNGSPLSGYYLYDDDGIKGQKIECIKDGVMKEFLTCRSLDSSGNGHGRAAFGNKVHPRQSNLIVEVSHPYTEPELRGMLVAELKRLNKAYGYYISTVSNGWTVQGGSRTVSSFNVVPIEAYRVYADGRADELVRGVSLIGTPLSVFSNIKAGGGRPEVFNGICGAQSGWIPASSVSPMLYVSQIETQCVRNDGRKTESSTNSDLLPFTGNESTDADSVIFQAMEDELDRCSESFDSVRPMFVDYHIRRQAITRIASSLGTCFKYEPEGVKNSGLVHVIAGDRMHTSYSNRNMGKPFRLPDEVSYFHIRKELGERTAAQFHKALLWLERDKRQPANDSLSEWPELPGGVLIEGSALGHWQDDALRLKALADTLSAVLGTYPDFSDTHVEIELKYTDNYRTTSEGLRIRIPSKEIIIHLFADIPLPNGRMMEERDGVMAYDVADLPPTDSLIAFIDGFARCVIARSKAECPEEREYIGPVLYQNTAARLALFEDNTYRENLCSYIRSWFKLNTKEYDNSYRNIGKKVISSNISVTQLGNDSVFDGHRLLKYRRFDADGIRPQTVELVRDGILLRQLAGRIPSPGAPTSTGNEYLDESWLPLADLPTRYSNGVMRISCRKTMSYGRMLKKLRRIARQQGLPYAYILDGGGVLIRVDAKTGKKELMRLSCFDGPSKLELMGDVMASDEVTASRSVSVIHPRFILLPMADLTFKDIDTFPACERFVQLKH